LISEAEKMLATFSNKLSQMESVLKEHSRALMELQTLLQLDAGAGGSTSAGAASVIVVQRSAIFTLVKVK